jgi:protein SCO1/2
MFTEIVMSNIIQQHLPCRHLFLNVALLVASLCLSLPLLAEKGSNVDQANGAVGFSRSIDNYLAPDVDVVRQDGKKLSFSKEINDGRPVIMTFVFTSCSAICPMISHVFSQVQTKLGKNSRKVHLMTISIDPENDTSAKLSEYAKKFGAGPHWDYYTGTMETSTAIQKAFNVYRGDKMNHTSVILVRDAPSKAWTRLEGFVSSDAVINEYQKLAQQK